MAQILLIGDDEAVSGAVRTGLTAFGHAIEAAATAATALATIQARPVDLVLLDLELPDREGLELMGVLREVTQAPIVVLSGRGAVSDKVAALRAGADDYVTKPFALAELDARISTVLRRTAAVRGRVLRFGELEVDLTRELVRLGARPVGLTRTEYRLLEALCTNPGKLLTHRWLLHRVWGGEHETKTAYLRVYVRQLRLKLEADADNTRLIATESGVGYRWIPEPEQGP